MQTILDPNSIAAAIYRLCGIPEGKVPVYRTDHGMIVDALTMQVYYHPANDVDLEYKVEDYDELSKLFHFVEQGTVPDLYSFYRE